MNAILIVGIVAFLLCLITTPLIRDLFLRYNIVDLPDNDRKLHGKPVPRIGGIAIVFSYPASLGLILLLAPRGAMISIQHGKLFLSLLPAAALIFLVGIVDDIFMLKPKQKLLGQLAAACLAVALGARMSILETHPLLHWLTVPISILWLVCCTNAVNLIDGLDGLASGVGLFATLTTLIAAIATGNAGLAMATVPLVGCLLAFLRYNFSPASVFLGDCGSLTIGFMLGCFGLIWSQHSGSMLGMAAPLMALALPLIDVSLSIGRRALRSAPIFKGDRGHIHHMVLARGFKPHTATLILYGVSALAAGFAFLQGSVQLKFRGMTIAFFCLLVLAGINYLGYIELSAARRTFSRKNFFRVLKDEIYLQELEQLIAETETPEQTWIIVRKACGDLSFASVEMSLMGQTFAATFTSDDVIPSWKMHLAAGRSGYLNLTRTDHERPPQLMVGALGILQESLRLKEHNYPGHPVAPQPGDPVSSRVA